MAGGWIEQTWEEVNPSHGVFDFSRLIEYVDVSASAPDVRPVAISVLLHGDSQNPALRYADWTPAWIYERTSERPLVEGRPVGYILHTAGCDKPATLPMYDDPNWQQGVNQLIAALAMEFDNPSRHPNLMAVHVGWGLNGLDTPIQDRVCAYSSQLDAVVQRAFEAWTGRLISEIADHFKHRMVWVLAQPATAVHRATQIAAIVESDESSGLGILILQPRPEVRLPLPAEIRSQAPGIPIGWRLAEPVTLSHSYWWLRSASCSGIDWLDLQWGHLVSADTIKKHTGLDLIAFARDYIGRDVSQTPGVSLLAGTMWGEALACGFGLEPSGHAQVVTELATDNGFALAGLSLAISQGWKTDERSGLREIGFSIDEGWEKRRAVIAGDEAALVRLTYLDQGRDTFSISYPTDDGREARSIIQKTGSGEWLMKEFTLVWPAWYQTGTNAITIGCPAVETVMS